MIANNFDLLDVLAHNSEEFDGFQLLERYKADSRRRVTIPQGITPAIRADLLDIFAERGERIRDIERARAQFGIVTAVKGTGERKFDEWLQARNEASFVAEHDFLVMSATLSGIARKALHEIVTNEPHRQFANCKEVLTRTLTVLNVMRKSVPNYTPRHSKKLAPGESFNLHTHSASIDFISNSLEMNIRNALQIVDSIEKFARQTGSLRPPQTREIVTQNMHFQWLRDFIAAIVAILNKFRPHTKTLPSPNEPEIAEPMRTLITMMELSQKSITGLLMKLESHPSMYASQHMDLLQDLANAARDAQVANTTPQS